MTSIMSFGQDSLRVLFVGNSYTYGNDLPSLLSSIAADKGDNFSHDSSTPGGYTFKKHSTHGTTLTKIAAEKWDYVVLQAQSQEPSFPPVQVASDTYPFAKELCDKIRENDDCIEPIFFMTWGRKNGDAANCPHYTPLCTYEGMQERLKESYTEMGEDNNASVSPVGVAWKKVRELYPTIELYTSDESHPSYAGSYLSACVFYATMYKKSPMDCSFYGSLTEDVAKKLQSVAAGAVLDSVDVWIASTPYAQFEPSVFDLEVDFDNWSENGVTYAWDFGDGNTSTDEHPTHTYATAGVYTVTLKTIGECKTHTISKEIDLCADAETVEGDFSVEETATATFSFTNESLNALTYTWDFGDGNTSTEENPTHTYEKTGTYTVVLNSTNGCTSDIDSTEVVVEEGTLSIGDCNCISSFELFPNPATSELNVRFETIKKYSELSIIIRSIDGKEVKSKLFNTSISEVQLSLEGVDKGIYLVVLSFDNEEVVTKKVLVD